MNAPMLALFDYGAGNLHSLQKGLEAGGARVEITAEWDRALSLDGLVLPGVGSFGAAVRALESRETRVRRALEEGLPCLGICLGMQLLFPESEEGAGTGIGLLAGRVRRLRAAVVPQMGWNDVEPTRADPAFAGVGGAAGPANPTAYYANSYICEPMDEATVIARTSYGEGPPFAAAVRAGATLGVQFHPEKSSTFGLRLLRNFVAEVEGRRAVPGAGR